jgi:hypothetical protein
MRMLCLLCAVLMCGPLSLWSEDPPVQPESETVGGYRPGPPAPPPRVEGPSRREVYDHIADRFRLQIFFDGDLREQPCSSEDIGGDDVRTVLFRAGRSCGTFAAEQPDGSWVVADDTPQNRREYEMLEISQFPIRHADIKEVDKLLRSTIEARRVATTPGVNLITLRDTAEKVAIARRLIADTDRPVAEIDLGISLLEIPSSSVPLCTGVPCSRIDRRDVPNDAKVLWRSAMTVLGADESSTRFEIDDGTGGQVTISCVGEARQISASAVQVKLQVDGLLVSRPDDGKPSSATTVSTTAVLNRDESLVVRVASGDAQSAFLLLVDPTVVRPAAWIDEDPKRLLVGTEQSISFADGPNGLIP